MQISKGGVTRPQSQIENNSQSVIRTRHLLHSRVSTIAVWPLENA